jgi:type II secretory pathway component PulF
LGWFTTGLLLLGLAALLLLSSLHARGKLGLGLRAAWSRLVARTAAGRCLAAGNFLAVLSDLVAAGMSLPTAIRRVSPTVGNLELEEGLQAAAAAMEEGHEPDVAWRRTWLPEFAVVTAASVARSPREVQGAALLHLATECRRRWSRVQERRLAMLVPLGVITVGALLALDFAALLEFEYQHTRGIVLW